MDFIGIFSEANLKINYYERARRIKFIQKFSIFILSIA